MMMNNAIGARNEWKTEGKKTSSVNETIGISNEVREIIQEMMESNGNLILRKLFCK